MPDYTYEAKKGPHEIIRGSVSASNQQEAIHLIEEKGCVPLKVTLSAKARSKPAIPAILGKGKFSFKRDRISTYQICIFTRQLAGFLRTNVPLLSALEFIERQQSENKLQSFVSNLVKGVRNGARFSEALEEHGGRSLDARYLSLVRAGESAGSLGTVLEVLADYLEKEEELRGQIKTAMAYPLLIVAVGAGTLFFLFVFCIPKLTMLFGQAYESLPLPTRILMSFSRPEWQILFWALLVALISATVYLFWGGPAAKRIRDGLALKIPILSDLFRKSDIARFCGTLALMIQNGIPIHEAVEIARPVLSNEFLKEELKDAQSSLLGGAMLTDILKGAKNFPPFVHQIVSVGEESGQLARTLAEVERFYSRESLRDIKILTSFIEPIFILALSLIVGLVIAAIMLPIFEMNWAH